MNQDVIPGAGTFTRDLIKMSRQCRAYNGAFEKKINMPAIPRSRGGGGGRWGVANS